MLYLIPFLHQTTTMVFNIRSSAGCILFHFYIKPQLAIRAFQPWFGCILFHFYIKPQLRRNTRKYWLVVSYSISSSNHNAGKLGVVKNAVVSYSISTSNHNVSRLASKRRTVVSYSISTSNHNLWRIRYYFQAHYHLNHILFFNGML